jgi:hypothetical protein
MVDRPPERRQLMRIIVYVLSAFFAISAQARDAAPAREESSEAALDSPALGRNGKAGWSVSDGVRDSIDLPAQRREFASRSRNYLFVLRTEDGWASKRAQGELYELSARGRRLLWRQLLPQEFGPRYLVVSDEGHILMLDEWINVKSQYAVILMGKDGAMIARKRFEDVKDVLRADEAVLVKHGSRGSWWISADPILDAGRNIVSVPAGNGALVIDLTSGALDRR